MSWYPVYESRRADKPQGSYRDFSKQPEGYFSSTTTIRGKTFYTPPQPITFETAGPVPTYGTQQEPDLYHLPPPEEGSSPPAGWDEWEKNSNWPFPANQPRQPLRTIPQAKKSSSNRNSSGIPQDELELNANWPLPPGMSRKRTTSQSAPRPRRISESKPTERLETNANVNWPLPASAPKKSAKPVIPSAAAQIGAQGLPDTTMPSVNPLLAMDSHQLVRFDLRLPYTSVRKLVRGSQWTHLNHDDLRQPACSPYRTQMRIYVQVQGCADWIAYVQPKSRAYITVGDVLMSICDTFHVPVDNKQWARDSVNPVLADRAKRAYNRRVEKVESSRAIGYERARKDGLLRVDYLGSKYFFAGIMLCYGGDNSEWWMMEVVPEARR